MIKVAILLAQQLKTGAEVSLIEVRPQIGVERVICR
jgi:hypothetical protein